MSFKNRACSADHRKKISDGLKRAYREGRAHCPTKRPEVAAKISAAKKLYNATSRPEVRAKISATLKRRYAAGEIKVSPKAYRKLSFKGGHHSEKTRKKLSKATRCAWATGRFNERKRDYLHLRGSFISKEELLIAPSLIKLGFVHQFIITGVTRPRYTADFGHPSIRLCVEIDGRSHEGTSTRDALRSAKIEAAGYSVIRFTTKEIRSSQRRVLAAIRVLVKQKLEGLSH